ncbi:MAG: hypothetical protein KC731_33365 [Myxococcales bacterium]|nr:hypothetical protein [Myxococcales bacterium]
MPASAAPQGEATASETDARRARTAAVACLLLGHFASYPALFATAVAGMPLSIILRREALEWVQAQAAPANTTQAWLCERVGLSAAEAASFEIVMTPLAAALVTVILVIHVAAVVWAKATHRARLAQHEAGVVAARRRFGLSVVGLTALVLLAGAVGWAVILTA